MQKLLRQLGYLMLRRRRDAELADELNSTAPNASVSSNMLGCRQVTPAKQRAEPWAT